MKILLAPDSFKDCLSATEVARHLAEGIRRVYPGAHLTGIPVADGGEGFVQTMLSALGGEAVTCRVFDPLGREIDATYGILADQRTAVIEMAAASGIELLKPNERNPLVTNTFGTGQLMRDALEHGCRKLIIGIGGSATNDGGTGMAKALGYRFLDSKNREIHLGGGSLNGLIRIDDSSTFPILKETEVLTACDVSNPLTGTQGASAVYGPQKGATPEMVKRLDQNLAHLSHIILKDLKIDVLKLAGGGAAGGLGAGLVAFAGASLQAGFDIVKAQTGLELAVQQADIVLTGEGKMDHQTKQGKTPWGVAQLALKHGKPCIGVAGFLGEGYRELYQEGFTSLFALPNGPLSLEESLAQAPQLLADTAEQIFRIIQLSKPE
ncbi:glycerate kinase [Sunxiuqinia dokdonensis]|uniref:H+-transporting two-stor ATPase n=1 Tax=Sunxiuqinia dokdonensis TaxID=1409788 RepID=A0A0L8VBH8_9BACT|nr:glycerate kinase [Sunxiuqinia dokdonensis]KOH45804.1 H+-transporting two-stor ATPase [Sunxiuqinia dokdonensis]